MNDQHESEVQQTDLKQTYVELFLLSLAALFIELLIIRWMSAEIRAFTIFKTFPLVTCFVGLGVGMAIPKDKWFRFTPLAIAQTVFTVRLAEILMFRGQAIAKYIFPSTMIYQWADFETLNAVNWLFVGTFMLLLLLILAGPFSICVCLGNRLGQLFSASRPLPAYSVNVMGSIVGSIFFGVGSFLRLEPWELWIVPSVILAFYLTRLRDASSLVKASLIAVLIVAIGGAFWIPKTPDNADSVTFWSPYQKIDVKTWSTIVDQKTIPYAVEVRSNWLTYQMGLDIGGLRKLGVGDKIVNIFSEEKDRYSLPYIIHKPKDILIVGAGSGTDVCQALDFDADHIDAVDIDPVILQVGKTMNPGHPYASSRVTPICDDARHYFDTTTKKYDLVAFAFLDSQTVVGVGSSIRVDNFVYTKQSFAKVLSLLKPGGLAIVTFGAPYDYLSERLFCTIKEAVGYAPVVVRRRTTELQAKRTFTYVFGDAVKDGSFKMPSLPETMYIDEMHNVQCGRILTDDWPYLYLRPEGLDLPYIAVMLEVLLLSIYAGRKLLFGPAEPRSWQLFFQGAAFMLLELQSISRLALAYGSTWLTTSIVINGVLLMILVANVIVMRFRTQLEAKEQLIWYLLFAFILCSYCLPFDSVLHAFGSQLWLGQLVIGIITMLPILGAGLVFAIAFANAKLSARALAFNIFGAVVGGMLEYISNIIGINALVLVAGGLYMAAFACFRLARK